MTKLTHYSTDSESRWALDGRPLTPGFTLSELLQQPASAIHTWLEQPLDPSAGGDDARTRVELPPIEPMQEVWASGVPYVRRRDARKAESTVADVYQKVYEAERPELFMKAIGWRVVTDGQPVRIRKDSTWNVPEPELTLVINAQGEIVGYTAGNDMSSRDIEGENPLYLPQAKIYRGACALGPEIVLARPEAMRTLPVTLEIRRAGEVVFSGETSIARMKRTLEELAGYLYRELDFPHGAFLMTGTGIVPPETFSLQAGDRVKIGVGEVTLENEVI